MKKLIIASAIAMLAACGGASDQSDESEKPKGVIPQGQLDEMEKAKGVEQTLQEADEKRREDI